MRPIREGCEEQSRASSANTDTSLALDWANGMESLIVSLFGASLRWCLECLEPTVLPHSFSAFRFSESKVIFQPNGAICKFNA